MSTRDWNTFSTAQQCNICEAKRLDLNVSEMLLLEGTSFVGSKASEYLQREG
jgi:hypothetical protein